MRFITTLLAVLAGGGLLAVTGCESGSGIPGASNGAPSTAADQSASGVLPSPGGRANLVELTARGLEFEGPDRIPSGWTTIRFENESDLAHFAVLERMPEGYGVAEQQEEIAPVFQEGMDLLNAGDSEAALAVFETLPAWFGQIVFLGGPGLVSGREVTQMTVDLEPGTYVLECYVKTNGVFHSFHAEPGATAMVHEITVTDEASGAPRPEPTIELSISSTEGITGAGDVRPGSHTVAVHFEDQIVHEHFLGHDVHLVRLEEDTDLDGLAAWMSWTAPTGLETPAPARFLGGTHEMPAGETAYFDVLLRPGRYAWIGEVPDPDAKGMFQIFDVPRQPSGGGA